MALRTQVWLRRGLTQSEPAMLELHDDGRVVLRLETETLFDIPSAEVATKWPALQMSAGAHFTVRGETYKISFVKPNDGLAASPQLLQGAERTRDGIGPGRANGKAWKQALG